MNDDVNWKRIKQLLIILDIEPPTDRDLLEGWMSRILEALLAGAKYKVAFNKTKDFVYKNFDAKKIPDFLD